MTDAPPRTAAAEDGHRMASVEEIGLLWEEFGMVRMDGRVLGYLMLSNASYISTRELREALQASAGAISMSTRRLKDFGFIQKVAVPGERSHFFRAGDDVWGQFLGKEETRAYEKSRDLAERILSTLGDADAQPRTRFENMRDYHEWLMTHHRYLHERWETFKRERGRT